MTEQDLLSALKEKVREELIEEANKMIAKSIAKLVEESRSELVKLKTSLIAEMLNGIEVMANSDNLKQEITFRVDIKAGRSDANAFDRNNHRCDR
jgi:hypothetical protein